MTMMTGAAQAGARYAAPPTLQALATRLGVPLERICKLDANESPYGPPPRALEALARLAQELQTLRSAGRYPDPGAGELCAALAAYTGVQAEQIVVGNGSDELIYLLTELLTEPNTDDEVVVSEPTFSVYALAARRRGVKVVDTGRSDDFRLAPKQVVDAIGRNTRLVYLCAPNNPTGTALGRAMLDAALARVAELGDGSKGRNGPLIVVDEAYYEIGALAGDSAVWTAAPRVGADAPLVVLRTFSKVFGLAGLRVGYALCPPELAERLRELRQPYNVNVAGQAAARAALDDLDWLRERATAIVRERERLARELATLPSLRVYPSAANFMLVELDEAAGAMERDMLWEALLDRGILVRRLGGERLARCLRITVGTPGENERLLRALRKALDRRRGEPERVEGE